MRRTVASGHRDEDVRDAAAQHFDLLVGDVDQRGLHRVERPGQLGQLVGALCAERRDLGEHGVAAFVAERLDECGQLLLRHLVCARGDRLDATGDRAGDPDGDDGGHQHGQQHDHHPEQGGGASVRGLGRRIGHDRIEDAGLDRADLLGELAERDHVERAGAACLDVADRLGQPGAEAGQRRCVRLGVAILLGPFIRGRGDELAEARLEVDEGRSGLLQGGDAGAAVLPGQHVDGDSIGAQLRLGELDDRQELAAEFRRGGLAREQLPDRDDLAGRELVADRGLEVLQHVGLGREHAEIGAAAGGRQTGPGSGDVIDGRLARHEPLGGGSQFVEGEVGGAAGGLDIGFGRRLGGVHRSHECRLLGLDRVQHVDDGLPDETEAFTVLGLVDRLEVVADDEGQEHGDRDGQRQHGREHLGRECEASHGRGSSFDWSSGRCQPSP